MSRIFRVLVAVLSLSTGVASANPTDALFGAAAMGDLPQLTALLNGGVDARSSDRQRRTPLHFAAAHGHVDVVIELLRRGGDINAQDQAGQTPLHNAARNLQVEVMGVLLVRGANPSLTNNFGQTGLALFEMRNRPQEEASPLRRPLTPRNSADNRVTPRAASSAAVAAAAAATPRAVVSEPSPPRSSSMSGSRLRRSFGTMRSHHTSPLSSAAAAAAAASTSTSSCSPPAMVEWSDVIRSASGSSLPSLSMLSSASPPGTPPRTRPRSQTLPNAEPGIDFSGPNVMESLVESGRLEQLEKILRALRFQLDTFLPSGLTLLHLAVIHDRVTVILWLLSNVDEPGRLLELRDHEDLTPLQRAAKEGKLLSCALLIAFGANAYDLTSDRKTFFDLAEEAGHWHIREALGRFVPSTLAEAAAQAPEEVLLGVIAGATCEALVTPGEDGRTPLHHVVKRATTFRGSHIVTREDEGTPRSAFEVLLAATPDVNSRDEDGRTPLHEAALKNRHEIVRALLENGADIDARDAQGRSALGLALEHDRIEAVFELLNYRPDMNRREARRSPLHWAVYHQNPLLIRRLLNLGAEVNQWDGWQMTPLHQAVQTGNPTLVNTLLGADALDIDRCNQEGLTALHLALRAGYLEIAETLLRHGANYEPTQCVPEPQNLHPSTARVPEARARALWAAIAGMEADATDEARAAQVIEQAIEIDNDPRVPWLLTVVNPIARALLTPGVIVLLFDYFNHQTTRHFF